MSVLYEIHLLHAGRDAVCARLSEALELEIRGLDLGPAQMAIFENADVPDAAVDDPVSRLAVFLTADGEPPPHLTTRAGEWLSAGTLVVPLVAPGADFAVVVPGPLRAINALGWDGVGVPPRRVVVDILRLAGLAEAERGVFISYRRTDSRGIADQLWGALSKRGFRVFLDQYSIDRGLDFQKELERELREKSMVLVLESANIRQSKWVMEEVLYAMHHKLGLLSACWEVIAGDATRRVCEIPAGYRSIVREGDITGTGEAASLREERLAELLDEVETVHARAMARRRKELLNGFLREVGALPVRWHGLWRLSIDGKSETYVEVTPRPVRARDLFNCEQNREGAAESYVLHAGIDFAAADRQYIEWIGNGKRVRALHGSEAQELARRLGL